MQCNAIQYIFHILDITKSSHNSRQNATNQSRPPTTACIPVPDPDLDPAGAGVDLPLPASAETVNEASSSSSRRVISSTAHRHVRSQTHTHTHTPSCRIDGRNARLENISPETTSTLCLSWSSRSSTAAVSSPCASGVVCWLVVSLGLGGQWTGRRTCCEVPGGGEMGSVEVVGGSSFAILNLVQKSSCRELPVSATGSSASPAVLSLVTLVCLWFLLHIQSVGFIWGSRRLHYGADLSVCTLTGSVVSDWFCSLLTAAPRIFSTLGATHTSKTVIQPNLSAAVRDATL